jgi:hypothetical protein
VRYNAEGDQALNRRQAARLKRLSDYLHSESRSLLPIFRHACKWGWKGIVSPRGDFPYRAARGILTRTGAQRRTTVTHQRSTPWDGLVSINVPCWL